MEETQKPVTFIVDKISHIVSVPKVFLQSSLFFYIQNSNVFLKNFSLLTTIGETDEVMCYYNVNNL